MNHLYVMILNIRDLDQKTRLPLKRIRIVNVYDQFIGRKYIFLGAYTKKRRTIKDINQNKIITERTILIGNFNTHNSKQNLTYEKPIRVKALEALLTKFNLIVINEKRMPTRRLSEKIFIINLIVTSPDIGDIITWCIPEKKFLSILNYEFIIVSQSNLAEDLARQNNNRITR